MQDLNTLCQFLGTQDFILYTGAELLPYEQDFVSLSEGVIDAIFRDITTDTSVLLIRFPDEEHHRVLTLNEDTCSVELGILFLPDENPFSFVLGSWLQVDTHADRYGRYWESTKLNDLLQKVVLGVAGVQSNGNIHTDVGIYRFIPLSTPIEDPNPPTYTVAYMQGFGQLTLLDSYGNGVVGGGTININKFVWKQFTEYVA